MMKVEARRKGEFGRSVSTILLGAPLLCTLFLGGCGSDAVADQTTPRADLVDIADRDGFVYLERPAVLFPHDLHTEMMLDRNEDCDLCHPTLPDGYLSVRFQRSE